MTGSSSSFTKPRLPGWKSDPTFRAKLGQTSCKNICEAFEVLGIGFRWKPTGIRATEEKRQLGVWSREIWRRRHWLMEIWRLATTRRLTGGGRESVISVDLFPLLTSSWKLTGLVMKKSLNPQVNRMTTAIKATQKVLKVSISVLPAAPFCL